jgi:hypothetical protein
MSKPTRPMKRRRFVTLVAMSGAALLTSPLSKAMAAVERARGTKSVPGGRAASPAIRQESVSQEKSLADQLKVIRGYDLPPGSPMAFVFKPVRARGRGRTRP